MTARVGVVVFPGSNCEHDVVRAVEWLGGRAELVWHGEASLPPVDAVVLPGGFAHGDYLRPGALARFSPVMSAVEDFGREGGAVVGICNGFQVLTEAGMLPGALNRNRGLKFLCRQVEVRVESTGSVLSSGSFKGEVLRVPINHFEGSYTCDNRTLEQLRAEDRVVLRYLDNPNGSVDDIAAIASAGGNIVGLMPHPERAADPLIGLADGAALLRSLLSSAGAPAPAVGGRAG
jgi:phosphoribosylformylglycinamidine synthase I